MKKDSEKLIIEKKRGIIDKLIKEKEKNPKKKVTEGMKKSVLTSFILLFPALLIASLTTLKPSITMSALAIALFFYQAILIKNFIDDYYRPLQ